MYMQEVKEEQGGLTFQIASNQRVSVWEIGRKLQMPQGQVTLPYLVTAGNKVAILKNNNAL